VLEPGEMLELLDHMERINALANEHTPKRPEFRADPGLPLGDGGKV
jgi:hypothetical protein